MEHPVVSLVKTFLLDNPEFTSADILGLSAGGTYSGKCKKSRRPAKGKCKKDFKMYDRPTGEGSFEMCCFRLVQEGKADAELMASLVLKQDEIVKRGKSFANLLNDDDLENITFVDSKKVKNKKGEEIIRTKKYKFTRKTLTRKILSLKAKWETIENMKEDLQEKLGIDKLNHDALLYMEGALMRAKEDTLSGGGSLMQAIGKCASAFLNSIVSYFKQKILGGGGVIQSLKKGLKWFWKNFKYYICIALIVGTVYIVCDNTIQKICQGVDESESNTFKSYFCWMFGGIDTSKWNMFGQIGGRVGFKEDSITPEKKKFSAWLTLVPVIGPIFGAVKLNQYMKDSTEFYDAYIMDKNNPLRLLVASKWRDAKGNDTQCQKLWNTIVVQGLFGMTVTTTGMAWMKKVSSVTNIGMGIGAAYLTGNPTMAMGAIMQEGKKGMNTYMGQPSFLENQRVRDLGSSALATVGKYATSKAYELETQKMQLEESIQNMVVAQANGIPIDKRVMNQQRQALNRVMAQLSNIEGQKNANKAMYEKGMDMYGQAKKMERDVILNPANKVIDFAEDAAYKYGETVQKRALTDKEKSVISGVRTGTNIASGIVDAFGKNMAAETIGSAVSTYAGSRYQGQNDAQARKKAKGAFQSSALTLVQNRANSVKDAFSEAYTYVPGKYQLNSKTEKSKKAGSRSEKIKDYSRDTAFMRYGTYGKEEEKQETPEEKDDGEDYEEEEEEDDNGDYDEEEEEDDDDEYYEEEEKQADECDSVRCTRRSKHPCCKKTLSGGSDTLAGCERLV